MHDEIIPAATFSALKKIKKKEKIVFIIGNIFQFLAWSRRRRRRRRRFRYGLRKQT